MKKIVAALCAALILLTATPMASATAVDTGYAEGLRAVAQDGLWGFQNSAGQWEFAPVYQWVSPFSIGRSVVKLDGQYGLVTITGQWLIQPEYQSLTPLAFGLYIAQQDGKYGLLSDLTLATTESQIVYDFTYDSIEVTTIGGGEMVAFRQGERVNYRSFNTLREKLVVGKVPSYQFLRSYGTVPNFTDVSQRKWYALWVDVCYDVGLMEGVSRSEFAPKDTLTVAEAIKLAAFLESIGRGDTFHLQANSGAYWYSDDIQYCLATGVMKAGQFDDYTRVATRLEVAEILAATCAVRSLPNLHENPVIPDLDSGVAGYQGVVSLYAKGIVEGVDAAGNFSPDGSITRGQVAAMMGRIARVELR